jgi:PleD family two-component response regulator
MEDSAAKLFAKVDEALYRAKAAGRNRVETARTP